MAKSRRFTFADIVYSVLILFYIAIGAFVLAISGRDFSDKNILLGILIILSSVPHILIYIINKKKTSYLIIGLVGTAFGILFLATKDLFIDDQICMVWGCIDICRGTTEIVNIAPTVKKHKSELVEILISLGDIVVGVLLCIHMLGGIKLHLIYLGIAFLITAAKNVTELIIERRKEREGSNNN